jgi:hypothetical protein
MVPQSSLIHWLVEDGSSHPFWSILPDGSTIFFYPNCLVVDGSSHPFWSILPDGSTIFFYPILPSCGWFQSSLLFNIGGWFHCLLLVNIGWLRMVPVILSAPYFRMVPQFSFINWLVEDGSSHSFWSILQDGSTVFFSFS